MQALFLSLMLVVQGVPIQTSQGGTIAGVLRDGAGKALAGVRIAAVAVPESQTEAANGTAMAAIAETDDQGRYRLENIPPGRYYIAAGRVDLPTYYPGTQEMRTGTIIAVAAGSSSGDIDFILKDSSAGRAPPGFMAGFGRILMPTLLIPIDVRIDGVGKIPVFGSAGFSGIRFEPGGGQAPTTLSLDSTVVSVTGPAPVDYRITLENLPPEFALKSMTYGATDLLAGPLLLTAANFTSSSSASVLTYFAPFTTATPLQTPPGPRVTAIGRPPSGAMPQATPLVITLTRVRPATAPGGVRVTGRTGAPGARSIYLSGRPGIFFSDGSFEFFGVPPGRHAIAALVGSPLAASVVVGNTDIDGIQLEETPVMPVGILTPRNPNPVGTHAPGAVPLASIRGNVVDRDTRQPLPNGMVFITGGAYGSAYSLIENGGFEFPHLLPGRYNLEVQVFRHETMKRSILVDDDSIDVQIEVNPIPD